MARIQAADRAQKLAKAIVADIRLYNADDLSHGRDVSDAVAEGRDLFRQRVDASLYGVFEEVLSQLGLEGANDAKAITPAPSDFEQHFDRLAERGNVPPGFYSDATAAKTGRDSGGRWVLLLIGVAAALAAGWYAVVR